MDTRASPEGQDHRIEEGQKSHHCWRWTLALCVRLRKGLLGWVAPSLTPVRHRLPEAEVNQVAQANTESRLSHAPGEVEIVSHRVQCQLLAMQPLAQVRYLLLCRWTTGAIATRLRCVRCSQSL